MVVQVTRKLRFVVILALDGNVSNSRDKSSDNGTSSLLDVDNVVTSVEDKSLWIASGDIMTMRDYG